MGERVLILSTKLNFKSDVPEALLNEWTNDFFNIDGHEAIINNVDWFDKTRFEASVAALQTFGKRIKNKVKGDVLVFVKGDDDSVRTGKYKLTTSKITFEECELNISIRRELKQKPKSLSEEEKIELFRTYWNEKHKEPTKNEVYRNFRIGAFYANAMKNKDIAEMLHQITNEAE